MTNDIVYSPLSRSKGFARLLSDCAIEKRVVRIGLANGTIYEGKLLDIENDVLAMVVSIDRFNYEYTYVPVSTIVSLAIHKDQHHQPS